VSFCPGIPASVRAVLSQAADEQASRPTRSVVISHPEKNATNASSSLATRASRTILPASSTTQIAVSEVQFPERSSLLECARQCRPDSATMRLAPGILWHLIALR
jgi:hypothetical protein